LALSRPLTDLDPRWVSHGGEGVNRRKADGGLEPVPRRDGIGLSFECPCSTAGAPCQRVFVALSNPLDGGQPVISPGQPTWERRGDDFASLTLSPSIQRIGGCGWHGWVRDGEVIEC
jgi:hypothetical protein